MAQGAVIEVPIRRLPHGHGLPLPAYASAQAAGMDLYAALEEDRRIDPGAFEVIPTGIAFALPAGLEAQIRPRSGLAVRHAITILNAPGTIDADYRGEIKVALINFGRTAFRIARGMRIAQAVFAPIAVLRWRESAALPDSARGPGGFGSTGLAAGRAS